MPPRGVGKGSKRGRQYEHVKESARSRGASPRRAREMNEKVGHSGIRELVEWARPVQERHFEATRDAALTLARQEVAAGS